MDTLLKQLANEDYPKSHMEFGGAGVIITDDPKRVGHPNDIILTHPDGGSLAWFVYQLKEVYNPKIDSTNKYEFYSIVALSLKYYLRLGLSTRDTMLVTAGKIDSLMNNWVDVSEK